MIQPNQSREDDNVSETDLEVLRELESRDVVDDRGDSIRASEAAAEVHHQQDSDEKESDGTDLRSQLEAAYVTTDRGNLFLPATELERLLSEQIVRKVMLAANPDIQTLTLERLMSAMRPSVPPKSAIRRIFAILVLLGRPGDIADFLSAEVYDGNLPMSREEIRKVWPHGAPDEFENLQWRLLAPFFGKSSEEPSRIYHYQLDDNVVLPFITDNSISAPQKISGGFGDVHRIRIHPNHHNLNKFVGCVLMLRPRQCRLTATLNIS